MKKNAAKKKFQVPSDLNEVQNASARALAALKPLGLSTGEAFDIRLCLEEALINAMKYGNHLKKELPVEVSVEYNDQSLLITVEDRGSGFDPKKLKDCTQGDGLLRNAGRGVYLIHQLMDRVQYNDKGNRLSMTKLLRKEAKSKR